MKTFKKPMSVLLSFITAFSLSSCIDMGEGDDENAFKDYISDVFLLSHLGRTRRSIAAFNEDIHLGDTDISDDVVGYRAYAYIGFRISNSKDVVVDEFALFMKTESGKHTLDLEFYVSENMPTKLEGTSGEDPVYFPNGDNGGDDVLETNPPTDGNGNVIDRENEIKEEDLQGLYFTAQFTISEEWTSTLFEFEVPQEARGGDYIIIKIKNNCAGGDYSEEESDIAFTINYLMFRFTSVSDNG